MNKTVKLILVGILAVGAIVCAIFGFNSCNENKEKKETKTTVTTTTVATKSVQEKAREVATDGNEKDVKETKQDGVITVDGRVLEVYTITMNDGTVKKVAKDSDDVWYIEQDGEYVKWDRNAKTTVASKAEKDTTTVAPNNQSKKTEKKATSAAQKPTTKAPTKPTAKGKSSEIANSYPSSMGVQSTDNGNHLSIHTGKVDAKKGTRIAVPMYVTTNPGFWGIQIDYTYNTSVLRYVSSELGGAYRGKVGPMLQDNGGSGCVQLTGNSVTSNVTGTGLLAVLYFDVIGTGSANFKASTPGGGFDINVDAVDVPTDVFNGGVTAS